jgi:hypothetical protein|mmetsp:Transcript_20891/g.37944  ORF Transcript_20891/g.37944 Transcript_20891/m.37944 type:complete len:122 (+) Transcript_20891:164-529(+)
MNKFNKSTDTTTFFAHVEEEVAFSVVPSGGIVVGANGGSAVATKGVGDVSSGGGIVVGDTGGSAVVTEVGAISVVSSGGDIVVGATGGGAVDTRGVCDDITGDIIGVGSSQTSGSVQSKLG